MCYLSSLYRKDEEIFYNDMQEIAKNTVLEYLEFARDQAIYSSL